MNPFISHNPRGANEWVYVGLSSAYPDITDPDGDVLSDLQFCGPDLRPGCSVFHVPRTIPGFGSIDTSTNLETTKVDLTGLDEESASFDEQAGATGGRSDLKDQVLVFKYKGKIHAVDHQCPHSSYPLSNGTLFDIEDFGIVLSSGLSCPKHGWSFDLFSGHADRGGYRLNIWEVQLRPASKARGGARLIQDSVPQSNDRMVDSESSMNNSDSRLGEEQLSEVWVRRKQRIG